MSTRDNIVSHDPHCQEDLFNLSQLADRIRLALEANRLRPIDVPRRGGPSRPTIYRLLKEEDPKVDGLTLDRLADAIGVSRIWLKEGTGPMNSSAFPETGAGKSSALQLLGSSAFMPTLAPGFGARMGLARREMGMSVKAAAQALKIQQRRLEAFESESEEPTLPELMTIALGYQSNLRHLTTGQSEAPAGLVREPAFRAYQANELNREILSRALKTALAFRPKRDPDRMAAAIADAYETASKPGNADKLEELVKALLK